MNVSRFFLVLAVAALATFTGASSLRQQNIPPEMQALIDKMKAEAKAGQVPSADEIKQLEDFANQYKNHIGAVGNAAPIPCKVSVTMSYTATREDANGISGWEETASMSGSAPAGMVATINGTGDYIKDMRGPGASMFTITTTPASGFGSMTSTKSTRLTVKSEDGDIHRSTDSNASSNHAGVGISLMTTGGDALFGQGSFNGPCTGSTHWRDSAAKPPQGDLDTPGSPFSLSAGFTQESQSKMVAGSPMPKPTMAFSYKQLVAAIQSGKSSTVMGSEAFDFTISGTHYTGNSTVSITLLPSATRLIIEPDSEATYEKWLPLPDQDDAGSAAAEFKSPQPIKVHVVLNDQSKPGGNTSGTTRTKPNTAVAGKFDIFLHDLSNNPGVCMNYPASGGAGPNTAGIYFAKDQPDGIVYVDEQHVHTATPVLEATVIVKARDTGGYGQIEAKCDTLNLDSQDLRTTKAAMDIPMDDNGNHIADSWEKQNSPPSTDAGWDACDTPSGMLPGDGISLYDKYRGFLIEDGSGSETFSRLDPGTKNLFVYLPSATEANLIKAGCQLYTETTSIKINYIHSADRAQVIAGSVYPRWVTFNQTAYTKDNQCAVVILDDGKSWDINADGSRHEFVGTTIGIDQSDAGNAARHDPTMEDHILVRMKAATNQVTTWSNLFPPQNTQSGSSPDLIAAINATAKTMGLDPFAVGHFAQTNIAALSTELIVFSVCHELGHATGAAHHDPASSGDANCPMYYWQDDPTLIPRLSFVSGKWDPSTAALKGAWKFCSADWPQMRIKPQ